MAKRLHAAFEGRSESEDMYPNWMIASEKAAAYEGGQPYLDTNELSTPLRRKKPAVIGVQYMGDLFHHSIPNEWIAAVYGVMAATPQHRYFILTKRPKRRFEWETWISCASKREDLSTKVFAKSEARKYTTSIPLDNGRNIYDWPPPNVIEGVSVEDPKTYNERLDWLLKVPADRRWISYEPALSKIDFEFIGTVPKAICSNYSLVHEHINLVVAGAETGPGARPANLDWFRSARDQCSDVGIPFFLKQVNATGDRELDGRMHEDLPW